MGEDGGGGGEEAGVKGLPPHVVGPGELGVRGSEKDLAGTEGGEEAGRLSKRLKGASEEGGVVGQEGVGESSMSIAERLEALSAAIDEEADRSGSSTPGGSGGVLALAGGGGGGLCSPERSRCRRC